MAHTIEQTGGRNMTTSRSAVFTSPIRTAIGTFGGSLKEIAAPDLGSVVIKAAFERAGLRPDKIGTVAMGNVIQAGVKMNPGRQAAIRAGLPVTVPAMTINRVCGSGAQPIVSAAQEILLGASRHKRGLFAGCSAADHQKVVVHDWEYSRREPSFLRLPGLRRQAKRVNLAKIRFFLP